MNSGISKVASLATIQEEAADWCARRIGGDLSSEEQRDFDAWIEIDPRHERELAAIEELWSDAGAVGDSPGIAELRNATATNPCNREASAKQRPPQWAIASAAALVMAIFVGWIVTTQFQTEIPVLATERGEHRSETLNDGTLVELDADSELSVAYSENERRVILLFGQAHFDVYKDPNRPFVVVAGDSEIRALGTSFQVYRRQDTVTVTLLEGRVEVVPTSDRPEKATTTAPAWKKELAPGEQLTLAIAKPVTPEIKNVDIDRVTAWQRGMMDFDALTLPEVVEELNRYSDTPVLIADPTLNNTRVSGVFAIGDTETLLLALETGFGIDARNRPESGDIALYPAE